MADMDVDPPVVVKKEKPEGSGSKDKEGKARFEVKKARTLIRSSCSVYLSLLWLSLNQWNAVSLWAWGTLTS